MPWRRTTREHLDDDHAPAAAWAARLAGITAAAAGSAFRFCNGEQLTRPRHVVGAGASGEQAVVADAMEAFRQHVEEEAADELVGGERHAAYIDRWPSMR